VKGCATLVIKTPGLSHELIFLVATLGHGMIREI
jgi:hypothetical protein